MTIRTLAAFCTKVILIAGCLHMLNAVIAGIVAAQYGVTS